MRRPESWRCRFLDQDLGRCTVWPHEMFVVEVEHVKARRTKNDKKEMSHSERFVTDVNEKADELVKAGAMLDEGFYGGSESKDNAARKRRGVRSLAVCSQLSLSRGGMERL